MNEIKKPSPCIVDMGCDPEATPARRFHGPHGCDLATSDHGTALKRYKFTACRVQYMVIRGGVGFQKEGTSERTQHGRR